MGTSAGNNGHRTANPAEGQPTRDEAYERVAREFLRKFSLDRDEGFAAAVARRFREAPAKVCCRAIGKWIDKKLLHFGWTQNDLADRIGVDRSAVAKWTAGGAISLGHLVLVLLEFQSDFADLPLPAREELALEGYIAALSHVRARIDPTGGLGPLDRERFWDPTSEASRWLEAVRNRSRAVSRAGSPGAQDLISPASMRNGMTTRGPAPARKRLLPFLSGVSVAALVLIAMGVAWRAQDDRLLRLETLLTEREARWGSRFDHLDAALTRRAVVPQGNTPGSKESVSPQAMPPATVDGPTVLALARIEARLGEVGERLREAQSSQNQSDPMLGELRRYVERLRKEVETRAQSSRQESHDLSLVVQEILQLLRRLAMRPWGPAPMQVPVPEPLQEHQRRGGQGPGLMPGAEQVPGQGQMPDQDHSRMDPGQGNRERSSQGYSGGYMGPRMQRPGGPG